MVAVRVDANEKIAMGHVMRCLAIAKQLKAKGEEVEFWISGNYAADHIRENGFACNCLMYEYNEKEKEADALIEALKKAKVRKILLDSYEVTYEYMKRLQADFQVIYIDDLNLFHYPANIIINYTHNVSMNLYKQWKYSDETQFLLGSRYVPLRPEFSGAAIDCSKPVQRLLITTGGADDQNMILEILRHITGERYRSIQKLVIAGKFYAHMQELQKFLRDDPTVKIYHDISNMAALMRKSNIAISAGGTTLAELSACGVPTICFAVADNQLYGTSAYAKDGIMKYAGDVRGQKKQVVNRIEQMLEELVGDASERIRLGCKAKQMIDGLGADRIADYIARL